MASPAATTRLAATNMPVRDVRVRSGDRRTPWRGVTRGGRGASVLSGASPERPSRRRARARLAAASNSGAGVARMPLTTRSTDSTRCRRSGSFPTHRASAIRSAVEHWPLATRASNGQSGGSPSDGGGVSVEFTSPRQSPPTNPLHQPPANAVSVIRRDLSPRVIRASVALTVTPMALAISGCVSP